MDEFAFHFKYRSLRVLRFAFVVAHFYLALMFCFSVYRGDRHAMSYAVALGVVAFFSHRALERALKSYVV